MIIVTMLQILYALAVEKYRNFSKAAASQFVSQPALSQQIKQLERELGYALFVRNTHEVEITQRGRAFCANAKPLREAWVHFQEELSKESGSERRRLRIGMGSRVYSNHLFDAIVCFFDDHPELEATFVTEAGYDFVSDLEEGQLDLALDRLPPPPLRGGTEELSTESLIWEQQCILVAKSDPRAALKELHFSDLHGCTVITGLEDSMEDRMLCYDCQCSGMTFDRIYRSDGIETNMNLLRSGKGVLIGPASFAEYYGVAAVPLTPPIRTSLDFICLQKNVMRPEIVALRKYLVQICADKKLSDTQ